MSYELGRTNSESAGGHAMSQSHKHATRVVAQRWSVGLATDRSRVQFPAGGFHVTYKSTQPCMPPWSLNPVPASAEGKGGNLTSV